MTQEPEYRTAPCNLCKHNQPHVDEETRIIGKDGLITCYKGMFNGKPFKPWKEFQTADEDLCGQFIRIGTSSTNSPENQPKK